MDESEAVALVAGVEAAWNAHDNDTDAHLLREAINSEQLKGLGKSDPARGAAWADSPVDRERERDEKKERREAFRRQWGYLPPEFPGGMSEPIRSDGGCLAEPPTKSRTPVDIRPLGQGLVDLCHSRAVCLHDVDRCGRTAVGLACPDDVLSVG